MKNKKRILGVLVVVALIAMVFLAGYTFARYYKAINVGRASTNIARWSFNSQNENTSINLSEGKIAPGSNGQFEIEVDATGSEVLVDYEIKVDNENNIPTNMTFYAETKDEKNNTVKTETKSSFTEVAKELTGRIGVEDGNQKRTIVVHWDWPFNEEDVSSTDRNSAENTSSLNCGFDIQIIGKQAKTN